MASFTIGKKEKLLEALIEIGQELVSTTDLQSLLQRVLDVSRDVFQFDNAIIRLLDESGGKLITAASYGYGPHAVAREIALGYGIMGQVARSQSPMRVPDVRSAPDYVEGIQEARSELAVPLMARERLVGVFNVESTRLNAFSEEDQSTLEILGRQAATAIANARLHARLSTMSDRYRSLHQFNERILNSVNLGIYTVDEGLRITSWNPTMEQMSGIERSRALGRVLTELFPFVEQEGIALRIRRVLMRGKPERLRLIHRDYRGERRFQKRRIAPLLEENGVTAGAVVIVEDITDFKNLLDQTIQSEKLVEIGRLSAGIAHEINNPLSVISYATQLLLREQGLPPFQIEMLERIENETDRLKTLTGGLLSFSRSGERRQRLTDINETVRDALRLLRFETARKQIELHECLTALPLVPMDANKIKQVVINLVMNAIQALGERGNITLKTFQPEPDTVELSVADDGPGIPSDVQKRMFEPFFTTKKEGEGTGLGLYICRSIVSDHGGTIWVESTPGEGTIFRIRLPAAQSA